MHKHMHTLQHTRAYMEATQDTHTHTRRPKVAVNLLSAFSHPGPSFLQDPPRSSGQLLSARGPSQPSVTDGQESELFFLHVFLLGFLVEETPCEHVENMQTPHRKAREIP